MANLVHLNYTQHRLNPSSHINGFFFIYTVGCTTYIVYRVQLKIKYIISKKKFVNAKHSKISGYPHW